jgi:hypothetical protein
MTDDNSLCDVFIIDAYPYNDEEITEYGLIKETLSLLRKKPITKRVETLQEYQAQLDSYVQSNYRYLHISSHGNHTGLEIGENTINITKVFNGVNQNLRNRRIFISACEFTNDMLAKIIFNNTNCLSLMGFEEEVRVDKTALFWSFFYSSIILRNDIQMV